MKFFITNKKFMGIVFTAIVVTIFIAYYTSNILFGTNSYEVYQNLVVKKHKLQYKIKYLQNENAKLQKQYLELKNLEPEIGNW